MCVCGGETRADEGLGDDYDDENADEEEADDEAGELVEAGPDEYDEDGRPVARPRRASAAQRSGSNKTVPIPPHSSFFVLSHTNR